MVTAGADQTSLDQTHALTQRLFQAVDRAREDFARIALQHGLTAQQARSLLFLDDPQPMSAVAAHLRCDASNVTGIADRLEDRGAVERVPGPDRRVKLLRVTPQGRRLRDRLARQVATESTVAARLTRPEQQHLSALLDKVLQEPAVKQPEEPR